MKNNNGILGGGGGAVVSCSNPTILQDAAISATPTAESIAYKLWELQKHHHPTGGTKVYPTDVSAPKVLTSGAGSNVYGAWVEVIPANTIDKKFDPHIIYVVSVENASATYMIDIGIGAQGAEAVAGTIVAAKRDANKDVAEFIIALPRINANSRIAARAKDDQVAENDISIFIGYHQYDEAGLQ